MENNIKVLPESVANQIAAGEVVQRPASAVKELLENAIDAGADHITLNIKDAGKSLIQVIDNGTGMSEIDARLCIERHATSKISEIDDIFHVTTMGFRGEAMASISAVSQMEIKTKTDEDELATSLKMEGNDITSQKLEAGNRGTSISVKNLFFNIPARRNFLKSNNVESRHINEVFQQVALSRPDLSFSYFNNEEQIYHLEKGNFKKRIIQLFGKRFNERLIPIEEETEIVKVSGFVSKPEYATLKKGEQFFLVNGRFIKSPYLHHAIMAAYEDLIQKDAHPQYFIKLEINPEQIDINIHPTKTEIKFLEERSIYAIIRTSIRQSLGKFNVAPSLDFERETAFDNMPFDKNKEIKMPEIQVDKSYDPFKTTTSYRPDSSDERKEDLQKALDLINVEGSFQPDQSHATSRESQLNIEGAEKEEGKKIFQLHNKYILTHIKSGLMLIDQHRAHQRVLYERFILSEKNEFPSQKILFPILVEMSNEDHELVKEIQQELEDIGYSIEEFGKDSVSINGVPPGIQEQDIKLIFLKVIEDYRVSGMKDFENKVDKLSVILARNMAIKGGQKLDVQEMESLIDQLFACESPNTLPNGKPIIVTITLDELSKKFQA